MTAEARLTALRVALIVEGLSFLTGAALNFGARIPLGFVTVYFPVHIAQAGGGEALIGAVLLAAGITMRRGLSWLGFWLSVAGIAFGLVATTARRGPEWDIHLILVPLAIVVLGLLIWTGGQPAGGASRPSEAEGQRPVPSSLLVLMIVTACTLLVASVLHFGIQVPLGFATVSDLFRGAAIPELVLGLLLGLATAFVLTGRPGSREMAVAAAVITLLLSLYGLSTTARGDHTGDIAYHIILVAMLAGIILGLLFGGRRQVQVAERRPA